MSTPERDRQTGRGLIVAAPRSGAGKTTVALALMRALARSGVVVQPFKCGPDYIDPAFHAIATGRTSYNLDTWAMGPLLIGGIIGEALAGADLAIVEGVMGLFDGAGGPGAAGTGATADLAAATGWPVVLVLDVAGQTETAAAVALGMARYREDVRIAGVVLNRVASKRHLALIRPALDRLGLPVLAALDRDAALGLAERHLGLVQAAETPELEAHLDRLADAIGERLDIAAVRAAAAPVRTASVTPRRTVKPPARRIAVARDAAFSFLYPHLLAAWRSAGAEILPFSPLADEAPAGHADLVWLPGGYPELHAARIASAGRFLAGLREAASRGAAVHGECGGFMVLGECLVDGAGVRHEMAGLLRLETSFARRSLHLGYRLARLERDGVLGRAGDRLRGHEFHYATLTRLDEAPLTRCLDARGEPVKETGAQNGCVTGTFFHLIAGE